MSRVALEMRRRGMVGELERLRVDRLLRHGAEVTWGEAELDARRWASVVLSEPVSSRWPYAEEEPVPPYW